MKVFIQSIPRETSTGIHTWRGRDGKPMNKTKNGRFTADTIQPLYHTGLGRLATGLQEVVDNPWFGESKDKLGKDWEYLSEKKVISRQELLEKKHERVRGFYTDRPYRKGDTPQDITYMQQFRVKLDDGTTFLDLTKPESELAFYVCLASKFVANSKKDYLEHKFPYATHYISHKEEDEELMMKNRKRKAIAFAKLESEDMTDENRTLIVKALHWQKGDFDSRQAYNILYSKIDTASSDIVNSKDKSLDKFLETAKLLDDARGREELNARALLHDLIEKRVVSSLRGTYKWISKDLVIGQRETEAVDFLLDPNKQPEIVSMKKELSAKLLV